MIAKRDFISRGSCFCEKYAYYEMHEFNDNNVTECLWISETFEAYSTLKHF